MSMMIHRFMLSVDICYARSNVQIYNSMPSTAKVCIESEKNRDIFKAHNIGGGAAQYST